MATKKLERYRCFDADGYGIEVYAQNHDRAHQKMLLNIEYEMTYPVEIFDERGAMKCYQDKDNNPIY